ncbi:dynein heavy chain 5, axonemal, partial [Austrofundulus limnaeus]|uniref:Dynein heavy chain 5, axonemal n=1 Tax=Austrofundulus limnaeus TaxID=52670 RepID=A0A2I4AKE6_AUSLI
MEPQKNRVDRDSTHSFMGLDIVMQDGRDGELLKNTSDLISQVYISMLKKTTHGGEKMTAPQFQAVKQDYINSLENFTSFLTTAHESIQEKKCDTFDVRTLSPADNETAAHSPETVGKMEICMKVWIEQIEQALAEGDLLRTDDDDDDLGPQAELEHWRKRMYFFNDLLDQLKGPDFNAVLNVLPMASSKLIKSCNEVHRRVINGVKEAEANFRYLSSLEKHCDHLYKNDPVSMVGAIP